MTKEGSSVHYPSDEESAPLKQPTAPHYYGTFQGNPSYPQPAAPGLPVSSEQYRSGSVEGYPVIEDSPQEREAVSLEAERRLPCYGIGLGWFLFIIGWVLASIPWYVGVVLLVCTKHDRRERVGLVCCTIAAGLSLIAAIVGGSSASS